LAANYYIDYKIIMQLLFEVEAGPLLVLSHFNDNDHFVTRLLARICLEIGYPHSAPLGSGSSAQFYWALPNMDLVMIPCLEAFHLLGLADLYHELGHFLLRRHGIQLVMPFLSVIEGTFNSILEDAKRRNATQGELQSILSWREAWKQGWQEEFSADMIAAFFVGPAFGWANVRLCTNMSSGLFIGGNSHPADDARRAGVRQMLLQLGSIREVERIETSWAELVRLSGESKPNDFDITYPPSLLDALSGFLHRECLKLGLARWNPNSVANGLHFGAVLNDAWEKFLASPHAFGDYERALVVQLKRELGML